MDELSRFFTGIGWESAGQMSSPLLGPKGNKEFLIHLVRGGV
jgi:predicted rRNA methylase YqxC with S4 and FtsJ domains